MKEQLIVDGYFPEQLPPFFTTSKLYEHYSDLLTAIRNPEKGHYDCVNFTIHKSSEARRLLKVPNPIRQLLLIKYILEKKSYLKEIFNTNNSSLSNPFYHTPQEYDELLFFDLPKLRDEKTSKVKSTFLENLQRKMNKSLGYQYCYRLDVANFYDSIYTHSIEWGFIGREKAKRNPGIENIGSELDKLVSRTNSKETAGIPTGPFTSRIISELILNAIDNELEELTLDNNGIFQFTHYVDDYEFYFRNKSDIHKMKNKIIEVFSSYRLRINEQKTSIDKYPFHNLKDVKREYDYYMGKYKETKNKRYLRMLFFKADELTHYGVKGAYKYLYKMLDDKRGIKLSRHWSVVEPFLIGHLLIQPSLSQYIVNVVLLYKEKITDTFQQEIFNNLKISLENHLHNEAHWLLWALLKTDYKFTEEKIINLYNDSDDDFTKTMLIHTIYSNGFETNYDIKVLLKEVVQELKELDFNHERWFLIHEWHINCWIDYSEFQNMYNGNQFYQAMKKHQVSFIS